MIKTHASKAHLWVKCAASPLACATYPEAEDPDSSVYRDEGILAASLAETLFKGGTLDVPVPEEMQRYIEGYVGYIKAIDPEGGVEVPLFVEGIGRMFADFIGDDESGEYKVIVDLKYGFAPVDAYENWQLACYAMALREINKRFRLVIYQPRIGNVSVWEPTNERLAEMWAVLQAQAEAARSDAPAATPGPHCSKCSGRHSCHAFRSVVDEVLGLTEQIAFDTLSADDAGRELKFLRRCSALLEARLAATEALVLGAIQTGQNVYGWEVKPGRGSRKWSIDTGRIRDLENITGKRLFKDPEPITPKQAITAGVDEAVINQVSEHIPGKLTLTEVKGIAQWLI